ncbi:MAG: hypothetical protein CME70_08480 [Halobacteriovorax sp.]|nr:hypothetical protein [Halobacteriovorax sp.]|tara:strand:- start:150885 stop:151493 length:609 start_codon:yes stop_codon:yes gene_type:complete
MRIFLTICLFIITGPFVWARSTFLPASFQADFQQVHKSSITGKEKKSKGSLGYKFPGHIRFETTYPDNIVFVSNPDKTWYYTAPFMEGEPGELTVSKSNKNSLVKFFDLLKRGLKSNKMYTVKSNKTGVLLSFTKKSKVELGLNSAQLNFKGPVAFKNITEVILSKTDKTKVKLELKQVKPEINFSKSHFIFSEPKNTRVSH